MGLLPAGPPVVSSGLPMALRQVDGAASGAVECLPDGTSQVLQKELVPRQAEPGQRSLAVTHRPLLRLSLYKQPALVRPGRHSSMCKNSVPCPPPSLRTLSNSTAFLTSPEGGLVSTAARPVCPGPRSSLVCAPPPGST